MVKLIETEDGSHTLFSEEFNVSYHSKFGAIQETQHVFIDAALKYKAASLEEIEVLDIGFGTGLNAFMTLLEAAKNNWKIIYTGVEAFPVDMATAEKLNYAELTGDKNREADLLKMHQIEWGKPYDISSNFNFTKLLLKFEDLDFESKFDIIYFDAFAPGAQPELWGKEIMDSMYKMLKKDGILVTYCAKGDVKRTLKAVGFEVEKLQGPPGKREMTRAIKYVDLLK